MSLCVVCGGPLGTGEDLCSHHQNRFEAGWAVTNRIMCNLLHRGVVPARLSATERDPLCREDAEERRAA